MITLLEKMADNMITLNEVDLSFRADAGQREKKHLGGKVTYDGKLKRGEVKDLQKQTGYKGARGNVDKQRALQIVAATFPDLDKNITQLLVSSIVTRGADTDSNPFLSWAYAVLPHAPGDSSPTLGIQVPARTVQAVFQAIENGSITIKKPPTSALKDNTTADNSNWLYDETTLNNLGIGESLFKVDAIRRLTQQKDKFTTIGNKGKKLPVTIGIIRDLSKAANSKEFSGIFNSKIRVNNTKGSSSEEVGSRETGRTPSKENWYTTNRDPGVGDGLAKKVDQALSLWARSKDKRTFDEARPKNASDLGEILSVLIGAGIGEADRKKVIATMRSKFGLS